VLDGGNLDWITEGLRNADPRLAKFAEVNEILAFMPWKLSHQHIQNMLKKDEKASLTFK